MDEYNLTVPRAVSVPAGDAATDEAAAPILAPVIEGGEPLDPETLQGVPEGDSEENTPVMRETTSSGATGAIASGSARPFVVVLHMKPTGKPNHFVPKATLEVDPILRTSGLIAALPAEEVKTLLTLLTFLSSNGNIQPTAWEVADALHISESKAKDRLSRLVRFRWQSRPLIATLWRESGVDGYTPSHDLVAYRQAQPAPVRDQTTDYRAAGREAIIAASRARYTRPRAEVEREIAMLNGWDLPENEAGTAAAGQPEAYLLQRLLRVGIAAEQAKLLLETFPAEDIEQQLAWLPYRGAKQPASYLAAAITGRYEEPHLLRLKREQAEFRAHVEGSPVSGRFPTYEETQ